VRQDLMPRYAALVYKLDALRLRIRGERDRRG
jgi:hypothetical protein